MDVPRRRNGLPQACEPCRKRKVACDHGLPTCGRCKRHNIVRKCVYVTAPMTRRQTEVSHEDGSMDTSERLSSLPVMNSSRNTANQEAIGSSKSSPTMTPSGSALFTSGPEAYLGPTSFSAVFLENKDDLRPKTPDLDETIPSSLPVEANLSTNLNFNIRLGVKVLSQLPDAETCKALIERNHNHQHGTIRFGAIRFSDGLFRCFGSQLSRSSTADLEYIAQLVFRNTAVVLHDNVDLETWTASFSGKNTRWDALGVLFVYLGIGAIDCLENDPVIAAQKGHRRNRRAFMKEMKECAGSCLALCGQANPDGGHANTLVIYLLYMHNLMESIISGDASLNLWRQRADLCAVVTSLGLHRDSDLPTQSYIPTPASETRRRLYASIFTIDKVLATLVGRPPMLSRHYSSTPLPLDISNEELLEGLTQFDKTKQGLDPNGWSNSGELFPATPLRARTMMAFIRDEVLEVALGSNVYGTAERARLLKYQSIELYASLPSSITYHPEDVSNPATSTRDLYARTLVRLEHLLNMFLIERLIIKHSKTTTQTLCDISREMLSLMLFFWKQRDRFVVWQPDFEWMIIYYAVPPSGVLSVELLKATKTPHHLPTAPTVPRSETIQNLTIFIEFLEWIQQPSAPNQYQIARVREILKRVLDQVLDAPQARPSDQMVMVSGQTGQEESGFDFLADLDFPELQDWSNFELLDTFDWAT